MTTAGVPTSNVPSTGSAKCADSCSGTYSIQTCIAVNATTGVEFTDQSVACVGGCTGGCYTASTSTCGSKAACDLAAAAAALLLIILMVFLGLCVCAVGIGCVFFGGAAYCCIKGASGGSV